MKQGPPPHTHTQDRAVAGARKDELEQDKVERLCRGKKGGNRKEKERERRRLSSYLALDSFWDSRRSSCHTAAPSLGFLPNMVLLGGWGGFAHSHSGIFFSSPQPRPSFCVQKWRPKSKCKVLESELLPLPSLLPSPLRKGGGTERATGGSERCCLWLMLRVAALADWGQTGKGKGFLLYPALPGTPHGLREPHGSPHPSAPCTCLMADLWSQGARPLCGSGLCLP